MKLTRRQALTGMGVGAVTALGGISLPFIMSEDDSYKDYLAYSLSMTLDKKKSIISLTIQTVTKAFYFSPLFQGIYLKNLIHQKNILLLMLLRRVMTLSDPLLTEL